MKKKLWNDIVSYLIDPEEYFLYGFENLTDEQKHSFVGNREKELICGLLNHREDNHGAQKIFMDKWQTYERFKHYYHREAIHITKPEDRQDFLNFCEKHGKAIVKVANSSQGRGIFKVDVSEDLNERFETILAAGKSAVVEELVTQAAPMESFNESSVNTIRVATFLNDNNPEIIFTFMRTGRKGAVVDNGGAGGLIISVDSNTGMCNSEGCDEAGHRYEKHPDSGVTFVGFQVPEWEKAIALAKDLALVVPKQKFVGWDLAYTDSGWVMIEGNSWSQFVGPQITQKKGMREIVDRTFYKTLHEGEKR